MKASSLDTDSVNQRRNTARVDPLTSDGGICHSFAVKIHAIDRYLPTAVRRWDYLSPTKIIKSVPKLTMDTPNR